MTVITEVADTLATYVRTFERTHGFVPPHIYLSDHETRALSSGPLNPHGLRKLNDNVYAYHWTGGNPIMLYREGYTPEEHEVVQSGKPLVFKGTLVDGLFLNLGREINKFGRVIYPSEKRLPADQFYCIYYSKDKRIDKSQGLGTQFRVKVTLENGTTQVVRFQLEDNSKEMLRLKTAMCALKDLVI